MKNPKIFLNYKLNLKEKPNVLIKKNEHKKFAWVNLKEALEMPLILDENHCIKHIYGIQ